MVRELLRNTPLFPLINFESSIRKGVVCVPPMGRKGIKSNSESLWVLLIFWEDELQVFIVSVYLNKSGSFIHEHPEHGWHDLSWPRNTINEK